MKMSSEKTTFYGLHRWQKDDDFLREEFNENFAILDDKILRVVTGSYTCDGVDGRLIDLGFQPKAVLVFGDHGLMWRSGSKTEYCGGATIPGINIHIYYNNQYRPNLKIVDTGFMVYNSGASMTNSGGTRFYIAFR